MVCSVHVLDMAGLMLIVRSVRAATFNDYIYIDEMNKMTLPSRHRIRNLKPARYLSVMEIPVHHIILMSDLYESAGKKYVFH